MKSQTDCEKVSPEQILSHLPTGIVVYDLTGDVVTASYMGARLLSNAGYHP
jgi:hypothetical protein